MTSRMEAHPGLEDEPPAFLVVGGGVIDFEIMGIGEMMH